MEELLLLAGYHSDTNSIRSSVTCSAEVTIVRKRSGRKQQAPRRAAFDSESVASTSQERQQGRAAEKRNELATADTQLDVLATAETGSPNVPAVQEAVVQQTASDATAPSARGKKNKQDLAGPCCHCNATSSPQWRKGPKGKPVLCNACGIRFLRNRTLTKVVPKKRRAGATAARDLPTGTSGSKAKRLRTEAVTTEEEELELATDEVLATDEALTATDDPAAEEVHSFSRALNSAVGHADLADATAPAAADRTVLHVHPQPQQQLAAASAGASSCSVYEVHGSPAKPASTGVQQLAAGSRHLLLGANSHINPNPSLSLALAVHQHQQQEPGTSGSPRSNTSAHAGHRSPAAQSETSSRSPPASPLVLGASSGVARMLIGHQLLQQQVPSLWALPSQQQKAGAVATQLLPEPTPLSLTGSLGSTAAAPGQQLVPGQQAVPGQPDAIDIFQLVQQMSIVLGGVGPAVKVIRSMQAGGAAAAALEQQQ